MKKTYSIIFFILFLTPLLYGADGIAIPAYGAELTLSPLWEREADARIWSNRVVSDFRGGSSKCFRVNGLCDESALNEINKIKRLSLKIIKNDICSGAGTNAGALALNIYRKAEEYFPGSDCMKRRLFARFELLPQRERPSLPARLSPGSYPDESHFLYSSCTGVTVNTGKPEIKKSSLSSGREKAGYLIHTSGLKLGPLWDREETDYYRIFLYIRDDDTIKKLSSIMFCPPNVSHLFNSSFPKLKIKTKLLHTRKLNTFPNQLINSPGVLS